MTPNSSNGLLTDNNYQRKDNVRKDMLTTIQTTQKHDFSCDQVFTLILKILQLPYKM